MAMLLWPHFFGQSFTSQCIACCVLTSNNCRYSYMDSVLLGTRCCGTLFLIGSTHQTSGILQIYNSWYILHLVPKKRPPFIFWITPSKITDFNNFWHVKSWQNLTWNLTDCPSHLLDVAHVPWEIQKVIFNSIIHTYFWLFTSSHKKTICNPRIHHTGSVMLWSEGQGSTRLLNKDLGDIIDKTFPAVG